MIDDDHRSIRNRRACVDGGLIIEDVVGTR